MYIDEDVLDMSGMELNTFTAWLESSPVCSQNHTNVLGNGAAAAQHKAAAAMSGHVDPFKVYFDWENQPSSMSIFGDGNGPMVSPMLDMRLDLNFQGMFEQSLMNSPTLLSVSSNNNSVFGNSSIDNGFQLSPSPLPTSGVSMNLESFPQFEFDNGSPWQSSSRQVTTSQAPTALLPESDISISSFSAPTLLHLVPSENVLLERYKDSGSKGKNEPGSSCHQCKRRRPQSQLYLCKNSGDNAKNNSGKRICRKRFCIHCLTKYGISLDAVDAMEIWFCPACEARCDCASCKRKRTKPVKHI